MVQKGQTLDAFFFTLNINPRLNFSIAYKGLRSEVRYINPLVPEILDLTSYNKKANGILPMCISLIRILNEENGGITTINDFESENPGL
jgi:hypothetical protein